MLKLLSFTIFISLFSITSWGRSSFSDQDLNAVMKSHDQGLIYLWSPFMPLSVLGREEIIETAKTLNLNLTLLVDPLATSTKTDDPFLQSTILMDHGILDHYPALVMYAKRKLNGVIIHGYEPAKSLKQIIQNTINQEL